MSTRMNSTTTRAIPMLICLFITAHASTTNKNYRDLPCKTPEIASGCFRTHARLWQAQGHPSYRLLPVGGHHIYGIYSNRYGFLHESDVRDGGDSEGPNLSAGIEKHITPGGLLADTYSADFEICPLEKHIQGHMQAACIESATHIFSTKN
jgi:hypothetical protein